MFLETAVSNAQEAHSEMTCNGLDSHNKVGDGQAALLSPKFGSQVRVVSSISRDHHSCKDLQHRDSWGSIRDTGL